VLAVQVLRRGDEHRVDGRVVEEGAVVRVGLGVGREALGLLEAAGVDVGESREFGVRTG